MSSLSSIARKLLSPGLRKLHKAGFVEDDLSITKLGRNRLIAILLEDEAFMEKLVAEAEVVIEEDKERGKGLC